MWAIFLFAFTRYVAILLVGLIMACIDMWRTGQRIEAIVYPSLTASIPWLLLHWQAGRRDHHPPMVIKATRTDRVRIMLTMSLAAWFPLDVEGALVPFAIASLAAAFLPPPYVGWSCAALALLGARYLFGRRHQALKPWAYVILHIIVLATLIATVMLIRRPT
jgi:hypothetical protein